MKLYGSPMAALALPLVLGSFALSGCGGGCKKTHSSGKLEIVTTIFPVYELARRVAGTDAMVSLLALLPAFCHPLFPCLFQPIAWLARPGPWHPG